jgi:hypothetical protein
MIRKQKLTLGLLVEVSEVLPLLLVDDGEDSGNGLSDSVAVRLALFFVVCLSSFIPSMLS